MIHTSDDRIFIVLYPGGAGGAFLSSALNSSLTGSRFYVAPDLGDCHNSGNPFTFPGIILDSSIQSFEQELAEIKNLKFTRPGVGSGHYRNIVAIREAIEHNLDYDAANNTEFIKINVDPDNDDQASFLANILRKKANSFTDLSDHEFSIINRNTLRRWYWIENQITRKKTMDLCLSDVFSLGLENRFRHLLTDLQIRRFQKHHQHWLSVQNSLYPDTTKLLLAPI
jgi:hypothetical protein